MSVLVARRPRSWAKSYAILPARIRCSVSPIYRKSPATATSTTVSPSRYRPITPRLTSSRSTSASVLKKSPACPVAKKLPTPPANTPKRCCPNTHNPLSLWERAGVRVPHTRISSLSPLPWPINMILDLDRHLQRHRLGHKASQLVATCLITHGDLDQRVVGIVDKGQRQGDGQLPLIDIKILIEPFEPMQRRRWELWAPMLSPSAGATSTVSGIRPSGMG